MRTAIRVLLGSVAFLVLLAIGAYVWVQQQIQQVPTSAEIMQAWFTQPAVQPEYIASSRADCTDRNPLNNAYFGALHVHTAVSADAYGFGVSNQPDDFYRFARGGEIELRLQGESGPVPTLQLDAPLDFAAITDHAANLGEQALCLDPDFANNNALICKVFRGEWSWPGASERMRGLTRMLALIGLQQGRPEILCGADGARCLERATHMWDLNQRAAERWYDRSEHCQFTSFVGYEYTLAEQGSNLHRNVIFKNAFVPPTPLSSREAKQAESMLQWLEDYCVNSGTGCDAISIPHNGNWSSGRMFYPYSMQKIPLAEQRRRAALRANYEVLVETMQVKGDSECRNGLSSVLGGADELCDFEKLRPPEEDFEDCGEQVGSGGMRLAGCLSQYSYSRYALAAGLEERQKIGVNPFKFGIIAATDSHNATGGAVAEDNYLGATGMDRSVASRTGEAVEVPGGIAKGSTIHYNPGGIAGVYAPENTREALFAAMRRRETFGTSGPRIEPRFFGGWNLKQNLCDQTDRVAQAYQQAVPMGSDLPPRGQAAAPAFLVSARKAPNESATDLQRLQVVKVWSDQQGQTHQAVFDVAGDRNNGATVNTSTCERSGSGASELCTVWRDPRFDPTVSAAYYVRAVENPSCRWLAYDCMNADASSRPATCDNPEHRKSIQERAWTSPIWYNAD